MKRLLHYKKTLLIGLSVISFSLAAEAYAAKIPEDIIKTLDKIDAAAEQQKEKTKTPKEEQEQVKLYDLDYVGDTKKHIAVYEDTLIHLARKNNLGFVDIRSANPHLDPWIPGEGAEIILPKRHILPNAPRKGVVINLAEMRLYYFDKEGNAPKTFSIGIGREGLQTPVGTTKVTRKAIGPRWRPTERMRTEDPSLPEVVEAGPDNPLGTHALYLGWPTYAIHGTNRPYGIGRRVSSGCIRMYPENIIKAYDLIDVGTEVTVVDQAIKVGWVGDMFYVEAHAGQELADEMERNGKVPHSELNSDQISYIKSAAGEQAESIDWTIVEKAYNARSGYPVPVLKPKEEEITAIEQVEPSEETEQEEKTAMLDIEPADTEKDKSSDEQLLIQQREKAERVRQISYND